jgi:hypothetical protein
MFHYGVILILSPKMVYIKSKTVEPERGSPERKYIMDFLMPYNVVYQQKHLPMMLKHLLLQE